MVAETRRSVLSHRDLHTTRIQAEVTPRVALKMNGLSPPATLGLFAGDIDTLECALLERMFFCKVGDEFLAAPHVDPSLVSSRLGPLASDIVRLMPDYASCTLDEFPLMYQGPKKALYERAVASLADNPVGREDSISKSFVKREKCNTTKAPRVIQPRSPRYNACLGRFLKPLEHPMYESLRRTARAPKRIIAKGLNLDQIGKLIYQKWHRFSDPVAVGMDATKFDMHVSPAILAWEHDVYRKLFPLDQQELNRLLRWQMHNVGRGYAPDGKLKYEVLGKRFSGDMNTAMGNCMIMSMMVVAYCRERGIPFDLVNNGDDCVVFMDRSSEPTFRVGLEQWFLELGFRMVAEATVDCLEKIEFCQMHPVLIDGRYRMVRNPTAAIEKDTFCVRTLNHDDSYQEWVSGVATGGLAACDGVPVMAQFYSSLKSDCNVRRHMIDDTGMSRMTRGMVYSGREVDEDARYSFYLAFGIDPDRQRAIEHWYSSVPWDPSVSVRADFPGAEILFAPVH